jgi:hypothetical protein
MAVRLRCRECWTAFQIDEDFDGEAECPDCLTRLIIADGGRIVAWRGGGVPPKPRAARLGLAITAGTGVVLFASLFLPFHWMLALGRLAFIPMVAIGTLVVTLTIVSVARGERWGCLLGAMSLFCGCLLAMIAFLLADFGLM